MKLFAAFIQFLLLTHMFVTSNNTENNELTRALKAEQVFVGWPDKNKILYYLDSNYTTSEQDLIKKAIDKVSTDAQGCVTFIEVKPDDPGFKTKITPFTPTGKLERFCFSFPGYAKSIVAPKNEQRTVIARGPTGCLGGSISLVMKYFAILLGRRNEHQRGDRDKYITMMWKNVSFPDAYRLYNASKEIWGKFAYDYCSITHNKPTDFASPGMEAFTVSSKLQSLPNAPQLSNTDCQLISEVYGCEPKRCPPYDCDAAQQLASTTTTAMTSQQPLPPSPTSPPNISTTTPSPCPSFCDVSPDESGYLLGPYRPQTFLLFSGRCVAEYVMDHNDHTINLQTPPELATTYFPAAGGRTISTPVTLSYITMNQNSQNTLYFVDQPAAKALPCLADTSGIETRSADCKTEASSKGVISSSVASSASSQFSTGDGLIYQYVVDSSQTNLKMMDETFTMTYQTTIDFLSGQKTIKKITAIQIAVDLKEARSSPERMAVFGTGSDGTTPYLGYVIGMPMNGASFVPLAPIIWYAEPEPLKKLVKGC